MSTYSDFNAETSQQKSTSVIQQAGIVGRFCSTVHMFAVRSHSAVQYHQLYLWQIIRRNAATARSSRLVVEILT